MHDINTLMDLLGYEKQHQIRERLDAYKAVLGDSLKRGAKNKILVDNDGLMILRRAKELEEQGLTLKDVATQIDAELQSQQSEPETPEAETAPNETQTELMQFKDQYIKHLESEVTYLRDRLEGMQEVVKQLPAGSASTNGTENGGTRMQRLRQFLRGE